VVGAWPSGGVIRAFDTDADRLRFEITGRFFPEHAVCSKDILYVVNSNSLEARSIEDGKLLWSFVMPANEPLFGSSPGTSYLGSNLVLFENLIFISSANTIYAIDLTSHQAVWTEPAPDASVRAERFRKLAVSRSGVLYVTGFGRLFAFNLR
jgi:outer membrane protein assembly factor BamB